MNAKVEYIQGSSSQWFSSEHWGEHQPRIKYSKLSNTVNNKHLQQRLVIITVSEM